MNIRNNKITKINVFIKLGAVSLLFFVVPNISSAYSVGDVFKNYNNDVLNPASEEVRHIFSPYVENVATPAKEELENIFSPYKKNVLIPAKEETKNIVSGYVNNLVKPSAKEVVETFTFDKKSFVFNFELKKVFSPYVENVATPAKEEIKNLASDYVNNLVKPSAREIVRTFTVEDKNFLANTKNEIRDIVKSFNSAQSVASLVQYNQDTKKSNTTTTTNTKPTSTNTKAPTNTSTTTKTNPVIVVQNGTPISEQTLINTLNKILKTNQELKAQLKGEKGDKGDRGDQGPQGVNAPSQFNFGQTVSYQPTPVSPQYSGSPIGIYGGFASVGAQEITTNNINVTNNSTFNNITVSGGTTISGNLNVSGTITGATFANDSITPNAVLSTGQTDEYCLTYESTGSTWEWNTCGTPGALTSAELDTSLEIANIVTDETGSGALVFGTSPTLVTPNLGTPSSVTLTNATGLPISTGISGLGTGVATFLATPSSANFASAITDETGSGALVFGTSPTLTTPIISGGTLGSVYFAGTSGTITQDNANLFWDDTNNMLGIGNTSPSYFLDIKSNANTWSASTGPIRLRNSSNLNILSSTNDGRISIGTPAHGNVPLTVRGNTGMSANEVIQLINPAGESVNIGPSVFNSSATSFNFGTTTYGSVLGYSNPTSNYLFWASGSNVGIGLSNPSAKLHIQATTEQLRLGYDASNYTSFTTGSSGDLTITPSGNMAILPSGKKLRLGTNSLLAQNLYAVPAMLVHSSTDQAGLVITDSIAQYVPSSTLVVTDSSTTRDNIISAYRVNDPTAINTANGGGFNIQSRGKGGGFYTQPQTISATNDTTAKYGYWNHQYFQALSGATITAGGDYRAFTSTGQIAVGTVNITSFSDFYVGDISQAGTLGTVTNRYGLNIAFTGTGITNPFGIYQSSSTVKNYFAGNVGIGIDSPDTKLHVWNGTAGTVTALANSVLTLENSTHAYLNFLVPSGSAAGIIIGQGTNNSYTGLTYNRNVSNQWDITTSVAGATSGLTIQNTDNTSGSSNAVQVMSVGGANAGDAYSKYVVNTIQAWSWGVDNSDSDKIKLSTGGVPGVGDVFTIDTSGNVGIGTATPASKLTISQTDTTAGSGNLTLAAYSLTKNVSSDSTGATYANTNTLTLQGVGGHYNAITTQNYALLSSSSANNVVRATYSRVGTSGTGTAAAAVTLLGTHYEGDGTGTIANWYGLSVGSVGGSFNSSRFTNTSQTITNTYGVYIGDLTDGTQTNTPYGLYQSDSGVNNIFAGNVGIGAVSTPSEMLHVLKSTAGTDAGIKVHHSDNTNGSSNAKFLAQTGGASGGDPFINFKITSATDWAVGADNSDSDKFKISKATTLGTNDYFSIDTTGNVAMPTLVSCGGIQTNASGVLSCTSDSTLKDIQAPFTKGLEAIKKINPQAFSWKVDSGLYDNGVIYNGFIAQNVQEALPEAITLSYNGKLQVSQLTLLAATINSIKELDLKLENFYSLDVNKGDSLGFLIKKYFEETTEFVVNGIVRVSKLVVGSREKPNGITLYDTETGDPYCVQVKGGSVVNIPGECGDIVINRSTPENNNQTTNNSNTGSQSSTPEENTPTDTPDTTNNSTEEGNTTDTTGVNTTEENTNIEVIEGSPSPENNTPENTPTETAA